MNLLSKRDKSNDFKAGSLIKGKWNGKQYRVISLLGLGENGQVYLVESQGRQYAMKIVLDTVTFSYEIQMIQRLNEAQGLSLGFSLFDIDDYENQEAEIFPFYVMTYKRGLPLEQFLYGKNEVVYTYTFYRLLKMLQKFHCQRFACGDLKPEHLLVDPFSGEISFVDYGGVTVFFEGIRQYTEIYDRGSWRKGHRLADSHYDLFSATMIFIQLGLGKNKLLQIFRHSRNINEVCDIIPKIKKLRRVIPILKKIIDGEIITVEQAILQVEPMLRHTQSLEERKWKWVEWLFSLSLLFFAVSIYFLLELG
ncbi:protein kinase domain-containing protein [Tepidibacillus fermentans]|uniref:Serine/threonine-protein kinase n=1 Tax=Tepidibacillus fermentans TaxID=1281767 RepID=A0A4R3KB42_9BACI|nr:serine/threonine-protein kinase [Tepidibacillus fermentans]TCS80149.1 serine/threonine-protein kinase [Tepidibacillus fermentans]